MDLLILYFVTLIYFTIEGLPVDFKRIRLLPVLHQLQLNSVKEVLEAMTIAQINTCSVSLRHRTALVSMEGLILEAARSGIRLEVGASTCVSELQMREARDLGASFISTVFTTPRMSELSSSLDIPLLAGVSTLEEAVSAAEGGATALKFYPASAVSPAQLEAICTRLNEGMPRLVAGGVSPVSMQEYLRAGADGFAVGLDCRGLSAKDMVAKLEAYATNIKWPNRI